MPTRAAAPGASAIGRPVLSSAMAARYDRWTITSLSAALTWQRLAGGGVNATTLDMSGTGLPSQSPW